MTSRARPGPPVRRRVLGGRNAILLKPVAIIIPDTAKEKPITPRNQSWALLCGSYLCKPGSQFRQLRCMYTMVQLVSVKRVDGSAVDLAIGAALLGAAGAAEVASTTYSRRRVWQCFSRRSPIWPRQGRRTRWHFPQTSALAPSQTSVLVNSEKDILKTRIILKRQRDDSVRRRIAPVRSVLGSQGSCGDQDYHYEYDAIHLTSPNLEECYSLSRHANRGGAVVEAVVARAGEGSKIGSVGRKRDAPALEVVITIESGRPSGKHPDRRHALAPARDLSLVAA